MSKTRNFNPKDGLIKLPVFILKDIFDKGYSYFTLPSGKTIKITEKDIVFKKEDIEKFERENPHLFDEKGKLKK